MYFSEFDNLLIRNCVTRNKIQRYWKNNVNFKELNRIRPNTRNITGLHVILLVITFESILS